MVDWTKASCATCLRWSLSLSFWLADMETGTKLREEFAKICFEVLLQFSLLHEESGAVEAEPGDSGPAQTTSQVTNQLAITSLLHRFHNVLASFAEDGKASGKCPLPRYRSWPREIGQLWTTLTPPPFPLPNHPLPPMCRVNLIYADPPWFVYHRIQVSRGRGLLYAAGLNYADVGPEKNTVQQRCVRIEFFSFIADDGWTRNRVISLRSRRSFTRFNWEVDETWNRIQQNRNGVAILGRPLLHFMAPAFSVWSLFQSISRFKIEVVRKRLNVSVWSNRWRLHHVHRSIIADEAKPFYFLLLIIDRLSGGIFHIAMNGPFSL